MRRALVLLLAVLLPGCAIECSGRPDWEALPRYETRQGPSPVLRPGYVTGSRTRA